MLNMQDKIIKINTDNLFIIYINNIFQIQKDEQDFL